MATNPAAVGATDSIGLESFMKILTAQLQHQDPLKPMDNQEFVAQMATFAGLEQQRTANEKLSSLLQVGAASQMGSLLGKKVSFVSANGVTMQGSVIAMALTGGVASLTIQTPTTQEFGVRLDQLANVTTP